MPIILRSYSQQSFVRSSPFGTSATNTRSYTSTDHFYAANNLNYYQPNIFYYHSTPWHYRYRSTVRDRVRVKISLSSILINKTKMVTRCKCGRIFCVL